MEQEIKLEQVSQQRKKILIDLVSNEDVADEIKTKAKSVLLSRIGPWKMAELGVISEVEKDAIIAPRLDDLTSEISNHIERVVAGVMLLLLILGTAALGAYIHEGLYIIPLLVIGATILSGGPSLFAVPFLLLVSCFRRAAIKRGYNLSFLGEPPFLLAGVVNEKSAQEE